MLAIGNLRFEKGKVKICVPIMEESPEGVLKAGKKIREVSPDLVELRVDALHTEDPAVLSDTLVKLQEEIGFCPILCTVRTAQEGGLFTASDEAYISLCKALIGISQTAAIDVEAIARPAAAKEIIETAGRLKKVVIASNHDFMKVPETDEIVRRLSAMAALGADVVKCAYMPQSEADVDRLKEAEERFHSVWKDFPLILIAMGEKGMVSRIKAAELGSVLTFASVENASAPGQIPVEKLRDLWKKEA